MPLKYRVQLPPHADWTKWRGLDEPLDAPLILSLQLSENVSWEQWGEIAKKLKLEEALPASLDRKKAEAIRSR